MIINFNPNKNQNIPTEYTSIKNNVFNPNMHAKYKQMNPKLDMDSVVKDVYVKRQKLPILCKFLMNDSCDYVSGREDIEIFSKKYIEKTKILIDDYAKNKPDKVKTAIIKELNIIKSIYTDCIKYATGKLSKEEFDKNIELILENYSKS